MPFQLLFTEQAGLDFDSLEQSASQQKQFKAVNKALGFLETNPRHPSLNTHKYQSICGINDEDIFEAYAENNTPGAYRIFWHYGPEKNQITIIAITSHP